MLTSTSFLKRVQLFLSCISIKPEYHSSPSISNLAASSYPLGYFHFPCLAKRLYECLWKSSCFGIYYFLKRIFNCFGIFGGLRPIKGYCSRSQTCPILARFHLLSRILLQQQFLPAIIFFLTEHIHVADLYTSLLPIHVHVFVRLRFLLIPNPVNLILTRTPSVLNNESPKLRVIVVSAPFRNTIGEKIRFAAISINRSYI